LNPGTRLGPHEIVALLGVGGMDEVYRAHDTKLNRDVALKVLPESFANDPDRLARFQLSESVRRHCGFCGEGVSTPAVMHLLMSVEPADPIARSPTAGDVRPRRLALAIDP